MAQILVLSDSHGDDQIISDLKAQYQGQVAGIFHCGDSELPPDDPIWTGIHVVGGNCDYDLGYQESILTQVDSKTIFLTHGHLQGVNFLDLSNLSQEAGQVGADLVLFGHIHRPVAQILDGRLFINPGSLSQPRGEWNIKMYSLISWEDKPHPVFDISFLTLAGETIPHLQFHLEVDFHD